MALEEGQVYNERLWKFSLLRLNQLGYFEQLKPDDPNVTETQLDEKNGTVDLTLKVKEKGKNSIGLNGGVSGLAGAFIGINYSTNNFLGLGETLPVQASIGNRAAHSVVRLHRAYLFDRPMQGGFTVFTQKYNYNQARQEAILTGQQVNLPDPLSATTCRTTPSPARASPARSAIQLHRSFKRVGIPIPSTGPPLSRSAMRRRSCSPTSRSAGSAARIRWKASSPARSFPASPSTRSTARSRRTAGTSVFLGGEIAGLGGTVRSVRPIVQYKQFIPMQKGRNTIGFNLQGSFLTGYGGVVAPPFPALLPGRRKRHARL